MTADSKNSLPEIPRWALLACMSVGMLLWAWTTHQYSNVRSDFVQDYAAGLALQEHASIYGPKVAEIAHSLIGDDRFENFHPPFLTIMLSPLSILSLSYAFYAMSILSAAFYLGAILLCARALRVSQTLSRIIFCVSLFWPPFIFAISSGQTGPLLAHCIGMSWFFLTKKKDLGAGAMIGFAGLVKLFPLFLLVYFVMQKNWKAFGAALAVFAIGVLGSAYVAGASDTLLYFREIAHKDFLEWGAFPLNFSVHGLILPLLLKNGSVANILNLSWSQASAASFLACVLLFAITLTRAWRVPEGDNKQLTLFAYLIVTMLLVSPLGWTHNFVVLMLPLFYLANRWSSLTESERRVFVISVIFLSIPDLQLGLFLKNYFSPNPLPLQVFFLFRAPLFGLFGLWWLLGWPGALKERAEA